MLISVLIQVKLLAVFIFGKSIDNYMNRLTSDAEIVKMKLEATNGAAVSAWNLRSGGIWDIKNTYPGHEKNSYHSFLYDGKYVTTREAGNIFAGIVASVNDVDYDYFQKMAGSLHAAPTIFYH